MWFPGSKFSPPQPRPSLGKSLEGCPRMSWRITSQNRQVWKKTKKPSVSSRSSLAINPSTISRLVPKTLHSRRDGRHQVLNKGLLAHRRISPSRTNPWWVHQPSLVFLDEERWSSATSPGRCFEALLNQVSFFQKTTMDPWTSCYSIWIIHDYSPFLVLWSQHLSFVHGFHMIPWPSHRSPAFHGTVPESPESRRHASAASAASANARATVMTKK